MLALALAGCGATTQPSPSTAGGGVARPAGGGAGPALHGHPQVIEPIAGAASGPSSGAGAGASVSVGGPSPGGSGGSGSGGSGSGGSGSGGSGGLAQPVSLDQVRQELQASGLNAGGNHATITPAGLAIAPLDAPPQVQEVIDAGNEIAHLPYRFGGGHGTFIDTAYDCSGSLSFVFAAAGLLSTTMTSGSLASWGRPGPGRWITVFANAGHTFMYVAGLRFDTVALAETGSRWSNRSANEPDLRTFAIRHPAGF